MRTHTKCFFFGYSQAKCHTMHSGIAIHCSFIIASFWRQADPTLLSFNKLDLHQANNMKHFIDNFKKSNLDIIVLRICVLLIFLVYGIAKWFDFEVELLKPIISNTWLSFLYSLFGYHGASYFLGIVEGIAYISLALGFFRPKLGIIGDLIVIGTALVTLSLLPQLGRLDGFIFKDVLLIGAGLVLLKNDLNQSNIFSGKK